METDKSPELSVVIMAYSRKKFLKYALDSVIVQKTDNVEIIVHKNFSDEYIDNLAKVGKLTVINEDVRIGRMIRHCIDIAKGEIIAFLDDDDFFLTTKLRDMLDAFKQNPDMAFYTDNVIRFTEEPDLFNSSISKESSKLLLRDTNSVSNLILFMKHNISQFTSSMAIRKKTVLPYLEWLEFLSINEDTFLFLCALDSGELIGFEQKAHTGYRIHQNSYGSLKESALSFHEFNTRSEKIFRNYYTSNLLICDAFHSIAAKKYVIWEITRSKLYLFLFNKKFYLSKSDLRSFFASRSIVPFGYWAFVLLLYVLQRTGRIGSWMYYVTRNRRNYHF